MKFTVLGAGAIGGTVGAYMVRAGEDVQFVDRARDHVEAMKNRGLTIRAFNETFTVPVTAMCPDELRSPLQMVLLAVKANHTTAAVESILPLMDEESVVVSLQNGLCEKTISRLAGADRTIGALVDFSADYIDPGLIHYGGTGALFLGELDGRMSSRLEEIVTHISYHGDVGVTNNIWGYLWAKLGFISMLYATALVDDTQANVIDRYRELMVTLASETYQVAILEGVQLEAFDAIQPSLYFSPEREDWRVIHSSLDGLVAWLKQKEKAKSGIWRDLVVRRRNTEVDYQLGLVTEIASGYGLPLRLTRQLIRMIHELEDGTRQMSWTNLDLLEEMRRDLAGMEGLPGSSRRA